MDPVSIDEDIAVSRLVKRAVVGGWELNDKARNAAVVTMGRILQDDRASARDKARAASILAAFERNFLDNVERSLKVEFMPQPGPESSAYPQVAQCYSPPPKATGIVLSEQDKAAIAELRALVGDNEMGGHHGS